MAHTARRQPDLEAIRPRPLLLAASYPGGGSLVTWVEAGTKRPLIEPPVIEHPAIPQQTLDVADPASKKQSRILRVEELDLFI